MAVHIALLLLFTTSWATIITLLLYAITHNPWVCSFILAGMTVLLVLENMSLMDDMKRKDEELEVMQATQNHVLMKQVKTMQMELTSLKKEREQQRLLITNLKLLGRHCKSGSF